MIINQRKLFPDPSLLVGDQGKVYFEESELSDPEVELIFH
jgi:hypothetical protein